MAKAKASTPEAKAPATKTKARARKPRGKNKPRATKRSPIDGGSKIDPERLQMVEKMMVSRYSQRDIVRNVMEQFGVTRPTANNYYQIVEREWRDTHKEKRAYIRFKAIKTLERAITGAVADRKWSAVARLIEVEAKLCGLNEPDEVVVHTEKVHPTEAMTSAQRRAYINDARRKREELLSQVVAEAPKPSSVH